MQLVFAYPLYYSFISSLQSGNPLSGVDLASGDHRECFNDVECF